MDYSKTEKSDIWLSLLLEGSRKSEVEEFKNLDTSDVTFSKSYYRKRRRIINSVYWHPLMLHFKKTMAKAAMVFLVMLSMGFVTVMAVPSLREATINTVKEWFDDHVEITYETEGTLPDNTEIIEPNKPTGLSPDVEEEIISDEKTRYISDYYIGDYWLGGFRQHVKSGKVNLDTEDALVYDITIGEKRITVYDRDKKGVTAYWEDVSFAYVVVSDTMDDLLTIVLAIK